MKAHRVVGCDIEILVEWQGYPGQDTWEPLNRNRCCVFVHSYFGVSNSKELALIIDRVVSESFWKKRWRCCLKESCNCNACDKESLVAAPNVARGAEARVRGSRERQGRSD